MRKRLKKWLRDDIFDIILYGSAVKGKSEPGDQDILVIFLQGTLRERLEKIQEMKKAFKKEKVDVKQVLLQELFSPVFFARTGAITEGISVKEGRPFAELLGFTASTLFWYSLTNLSHAQKVTFNYALAGRGAAYGLLAQLSGERLVNGAVKIPIKHSLEFEEILRRHNVDFKRRDILEVKH